MAMLIQILQVILTKRKSTTGYVFTLARGVVSWLSKLHTVMYCDSQSVLYIARNPIFHSRTKHIGVQYYFVRKAIKEESVDILKIHTKDNLIDVMTKPINANKFK